MPKYFVVDVPATSANVGPGFDCFGLALRLYNTFAFRTLDDQPGELIFNADFPLKQNPRENLIYKAYIHTLKSLGISEIPGIEINVLSKIPSARGLGSSASAVVAGVLAAGAISNTNLRLSEAIRLATDIEGHPDNVAPAILGGMTVSIQDNNWVYTETVDFPDDLAVMVAIPDIRVHTATSRRVLPTQVPFEDAVFNLRRTALFIAALQNKDWNGLKFAMHDKLHQNQRAPGIPGLMRILHNARNNGAIGAVLSGSGPSVLVLTHKSKTECRKNISRNIIKTWKHLNINSRVLELDVQRKSTRIQKISEERFQRIVKPIKRSHNKPHQNHSNNNSNNQ